MTVDLPEQMWIIIGNALGNHPYREAAPVINEIQKQIDAQRPFANGKDAPEVNMPAS